MANIELGSESLPHIALEYARLPALPVFPGERGRTMSLRACLFGLLCLLGATLAHGGGHAARAERCIAENSGADSAACLEKVHAQTQQEIRRLQRAILARLARQREAGELTETHHQLAVSSLRAATKSYAGFSAQQCDFAVGASGAMASGSAQVRWSCLIRLADSRISYLEVILSCK